MRIRRLLGVASIGTFLLITQVVSGQTFTKITEGDIANDLAESEGGYWGDFNNDGWVDLLVPNGLFINQANFLYMNNGDGTFTKSTEDALSLGGDDSRGATLGDYNNDGYIDIFIVNQTGAHHFYKNDNGTFVPMPNSEIVVASGVSITTNWVDYDNDGFLDVFATNAAGNNLLYHNNGDESFTKITNDILTTDPIVAITSTWGDFDDDGDQDVIVGGANAGSFSAFYINNGDGSFMKDTNRITASGLAGGRNWVDYDNDGDLDLIAWFSPEPASGKFAGPSKIFRNEGATNNYSFTLVETGLLATDTTNIGLTSWADIDNDGDLDLFNSLISVDTSGVYLGAPEQNSLFENNGDGSFSKLSMNPIVDEMANSSTGSAWADYDNDGDLDLFVAVNESQPNKNLLYRNDNNNGNNWIKVKCVGTKSNRSAIGTSVRAKATIEGKEVWQRRDISANSNFLGQDDLTVHFGLRDATMVDSIIIRWPSGHIQELSNVEINRFLEIDEPMETSVANLRNRLPSNFILHQNYPNPFNPSTRINYKLDQAAEVVVKVYSTLGQEIKTLVNESQEAGTYSVVWDGKNDRNQLVASGIYIYELKSGAKTHSRKMLLLR